MSELPFGVTRNGNGYRARVERGGRFLVNKTHATLAHAVRAVRFAQEIAIVQPGHSRWTQTMDDTLRVMWATPASAAAIARDMRITEERRDRAGSSAGTAAAA